MINTRISILKWINFNFKVYDFTKNRERLNVMNISIILKIQSPIFSQNGETMKKLKISKTIRNFSKNIIKMNLKNKVHQLK
jgi:hypothetical protein